MSDVFISYANGDREEARALADALLLQKWSVWWDRSILPGKSFDVVIEKALASARCVIVIWSQESVSSDWVKTEASEGAKRDILVPVMIDDVTIPLEFRRIQAANISSWSGDSSDPEFQGLLKAVRAILTGTQTIELKEVQASIDLDARTAVEPSESSQAGASAGVVPKGDGQVVKRATNKLLAVAISVGVVAVGGIALQVYLLSVGTGAEPSPTPGKSDIETAAAQSEGTQLASEASRPGDSEAVPDPTQGPESAEPVTVVSGISGGASEAPATTTDDGTAPRTASTTAVEARASDYDPSDGVEAKIRTIFDRVSEITGLDPTEPVPMRFVDEEEMTSFVFTRLVGGLVSDKEIIQKESEVWKHLGALPDDFDYFETRARVIGEAVRGLLAIGDRATGEFLVSTHLQQLKLQDELAIGMQYIKLLRGSHLPQTNPGSLERSASWDALVTGEQILLAEKYLESYATSEQRRQMEVEMSQRPVATPMFHAAPFILQNLAVFPEIRGPHFVRTLLETVRWPDLERVFNKPPISTAQIYHPDKYLAGEAPADIELPELVPSLGPGWSEVHSGMIGQLGVRLYAAIILGSDRYAEVSAGWRGDRYALLRGPLGERAMAAVLAWDTVEDARDFFDTIESSTAPSDKHVDVGIKDDRTLFIVAPHESVTAKLKDQFPDFRE